MYDVFGVRADTSISDPAYRAARGEADDGSMAWARRRRDELCAELPSVGVTAFCPALRGVHDAGAYSRLRSTFRPRTAERAASVLGVHLDGPLRAPVHDEATPRGEPHLAGTIERARGQLAEGEIDRIYGGEVSAAEGVALVTIAPELPGALDAVRLLRSRGVVVGIGRTEAMLAECAKAVAAGATFVAHLFNHMPSFHHRDPGPVGLLGADSGAADGAEGVDGDGVGGGDAAGRVSYTLAVGAKMMHDSTIRLAQLTHPRGLIVASDVPQRAGSGKGEEGVSALDACVRHVWRSTGYADPSAALLAASAHPAALLGLRNKGSLAPGADADLVLLDGELQVLGCYVGGLLAWEHPKMHGAYWWHR